MSDAGLPPVFDAAADAYDDELVPAFFDEWAGHITGLLGSPPDGGTVLDVGCGTGVLAPHLAAAGWRRIVGVDPADGMLARARARGVNGAEWVKGTAEEIPAHARPAQALASNFALMFMPHPANAVRAMAAAVQVGRPVVVCTWGSTQAIPAMGAICESLEACGGSEASAVVRRAFSMGDHAALEQIAHDADLPGATVTDHRVTVRFPNVESIATAYAGPLGLCDPGRADELAQALAPRLAEFTHDGEVAWGMTGLIITGTGTAEG